MSAPPSLPPYGFMPAHLQEAMDKSPMPPSFSIAGRPGTPAEFQDFLHTLVAQMSDFLWPRWNRGTAAWEGKAAALVLQLSEADLDLMQGPDLQGMLLKPVTSRGRPLPALHGELFRSEDDSRLNTLKTYLPDTQAELARDTTEAFHDALGDNASPSLLRFKEEFQRPRPLQTAWMMQRSFSHQLAKSAVTPSLMSGHCIQGVLGACGAYLRMRERLEAVEGAVQDVKQFAVDVGDRRVFAGVHFPSDNIASWYIALHLCHHVFGQQGQAAKDFIRDAMATSHVYVALKNDVDQDPASRFAAAMRLLDAEAQRPV